MKRRVLIDLNVLLDVLARRKPHYDASAQVWAAAEAGEIEGLVSADCFTALYYILRRAADSRTAMRGVRSVYDVFEVLAVDKTTIRQAMDSPLRDFEDAVQYHCALRGGAEMIVTRDVGHFQKSDVPVLTPEGFLALGPSR